MRNPFRRSERVVTRTVYRRVPVPVITRDFEAATSDRLTSSWSTTPSSLNQFIEAQLVALKARSRDQGVNNPYALKYVELCKANIVGPRGVRLQAQVRLDVDVLDKPTNAAIEDGWREWGEDAANCDAAGKLTWIDIQELAIQTVVEDGEFLARIITGPDGGLFGLRIQVIETDRIDVTHRNDLANGNRIRQGIEYNSWGKPVAYWILREAPEYAVGFMTMSADRERVPADQIIHMFRTRQAGQYRGIPWLHASLWHLKQLHGWLQAGVVAARLGASKVGFFESDGTDGYEGDEEDAEESPIIDVGDPGTFSKLPAGNKLSTWDPKYPEGETRDFAKVLLMGISVGGNVAYHALSGDLEGVNYSSIRAGVLEDRETWKGLQRWFIEHFVSPVYKRWVVAATLNQALVTIDGTPLMDGDVRRFYRVHWQGRRWPWVDPLKDWVANKTMLETNTGSPSSIIRNQGNDPDEVFREISEDNEKLKSYGLKPYTAITPTVAVTASPKVEDDDKQEADPETGDEPKVDDKADRSLALATRKPVSNERAFVYAAARIRAGFFNADDEPWTFVEADRVALAEKPARYHLTRDAETDYWDHPTGRFNDAGEYIVYLAALETAAENSIEEDVISAALELAGIVDATEAEGLNGDGDGDGIGTDGPGGDGDDAPPKPPEDDPDIEITLPAGATSK